MLVVCFEFLFVLSLFCKVELVTICGPDEFPCNDGSCVEKDRWCDSSLDCDSDEIYCSLTYGYGSNKNPNGCNETLFFLCDDGECIPTIGRCDGYSSCYDNSDEENCDTAENITGASSSWITQIPVKKITEKSILTLNGDDFKAADNLHENLMPDVLQETAIRNTTIPVIENSDSSESLSNPVLKQTHNAHFQASENRTKEDSKINYLAFNYHQQPVEFRRLLGGILNNSRNELKNTSRTNLTFQNSDSFKESSSEKLDSKTDVSSDVMNVQSNKSNHSEILNITKENKASLNIADKEEDLKKGYENLNARDFQKSKEKALQWLINSRDKDYGWGDETARAWIALHMADYVAENQSERMLMRQRLHLKLFTSLSRNKTERIPLVELALYINALSASCDNPTNFYGHDLINILRHRTNAAQESSEFVTPYVYLVLCLNKASSYEDVEKVHEMLHNITILKIDIEAMMSLAATCISRNKEFLNVDIELIAAKKLYRKIMDGLPTNIYELALMTQALNEAGINQKLWNRAEAMERITQLQEEDGSFGDILATYYALPTLSGKSFLSLGENCPNENTDFSPLEILKNGKDEMFVHYSLHFATAIKMSLSLMIKVPKNTSFIDIMRIAATINPVYKFKYYMSQGKPLVYSIGGIANDADRGSYWSPYTFENSTKEYVLFEGDIRSFIPAHGEHVAFWMKSLF